jgi:ADP-ribosylglycohydrolase
LALVSQEIDAGPDVRIRAGHGFVSVSDPWVELSYESRTTPTLLFSGTLPEATREGSPGRVIRVAGASSSPAILEVLLESSDEVRSAIMALPGGDGEVLALLPPDAWTPRPARQGAKRRAPAWKPHRFEIVELASPARTSRAMRVRVTVPSAIPEDQGVSLASHDQRLGIGMPTPGPRSDRIAGAWTGACIGLAVGKHFDSLSRTEARDAWRAAPAAYDTSAALGPSAATTLATGALVACLECDGTVPDAAHLAEVFSGRVVADLLPRSVQRGLVHFRAGALPPRSGRSILEPGPAWDEDTGAGARAFVWGLLFPGDPYRAASAATRDASITHTSTGVEAARFVAALVAGSLADPAPGVSELLDLGESFLVEGSEAENVIAGTRENWTRTRKPDSTAAWLEATWLPRAQERLSTQPWSHALPNLGLVVLALEAGGGDFARTMRVAASSGLDASANAATCGAVLGARGGTRALPEELREPLRGAFRSAVIGAENWRATTLAATIETVGSTIRFDPSAN